MTSNLFQIDIETTGVNIKDDDILQITIVQMLLRPDGLYQPGKVFNELLPSVTQPTSDFAKEHQIELYSKCNDLAKNNLPCCVLPKMRDKILSFLKDCGCDGHKAVFCGVNSSSFDLPFLVEKGMLITGDFSYRIYEISGLLYGVSDSLGITYRNELIEKCIASDCTFDIPIGNRHDGLYDCLRQIKLVNGLLTLIRKGAN